MLGQVVIHPLGQCPKDLTGEDTIDVSFDICKDQQILLCTAEFVNTDPPSLESSYLRPYGRQPKH